MSAGSLSLTVQSPVQSFAEPLSLAEVRSFLELPDVDPPDSERTLMLQKMIVRARHQVEILEDKDFVLKQWDLYHDGFCSSDQIELLRRPLVSVDLVRYRDSDGAYTTLAEGTHYVVDLNKQPGIIMPAYGESWPSFTPYPSSSLLIRFTSGYSPTDAFWNDAGEDAKGAMLYLVSGWFSNRLPYEAGVGEIREYLWTVNALAYSNPRIG